MDADHIDAAGFYKVGDQPPDGYLELQEWARIQMRGGLTQARCKGCGLFRFPQEKCCTPKESPDAR